LPDRHEQLTLGQAHLPLRDQIREELRSRITDGRLPPGTKVVERELAAELGVSRVPVREALRMLESDGFVQVIARKGVIVRTLSRRDVEELFDVREYLEVPAARRAAAFATETELADVARILDKGLNALPHDPLTAMLANEAFHDALVAMAHNSLLASILEPLQGRLHWLFRQSPDIEELVREHQAMLEVIASRNADAAAAMALEHVTANRNYAIIFLFGSHSEDASNQSRPPRAV
jgi:DNA-binding GntR family transcriptional regulator